VSETIGVDMEVVEASEATGITRSVDVGEDAAAVEGDAETFDWRLSAVQNCD
jgi:hypothetical protein